MEAYRNGDKKAWDTLCKRYTDKLFRFFVNQTGNREDAKDLAQDTLIEAMVNLSTLRNPESFGAWLHKISDGILAKYFRDRYKWGIHESIDEGVLETRAPTLHRGISNPTISLLRKNIWTSSTVWWIGYRNRNVKCSD